MLEKVRDAVLDAALTPLARRPALRKCSEIHYTAVCE